MECEGDLFCDLLLNPSGGDGGSNSSTNIVHEEEDLGYSDGLYIYICSRL